jgi:hypothetical protein
MKRVIIYLSLIFSAWVILNGCYKDIVAPEKDYPPQAVSFKNDLAPLFKKNCTDVGCHVVGSHVPYMDSTQNTFKNIVTANYVNIVFPKESKLYQMVNGEMSPYTTTQEKLKIYDWIRNGAKNN